jgi:hypothetical protein
MRLQPQVRSCISQAVVLIPASDAQRRLPSAVAKPTLRDAADGAQHKVTETRGTPERSACPHKSSALPWDTCLACRTADRPAAHGAGYAAVLLGTGWRKTRTVKQGGHWGNCG